MKIKNNFILAVLILISLSIQGQIDTINQTNEQGHKFGYWKEYHENGILKSVGNYKIIERQISPEILFFYGLEDVDSIVTRSVKISEWNNYDIFAKLENIEKYHDGFRYFIEKYSYDENGVLIKTERNGIKTFFGIGKNIEIEKLYYFMFGTIGNTNINYLTIKSSTEQNTYLDFKPSSKRIKFHKNFSVIKPNSTLMLPFSNSIEPGIYKDYIEITFVNPDTNKIRIEIDSYGYHLSSHNLQLSNEELKTIRLKEGKMLYFREYEECEMKIYKFGNTVNHETIQSEKTQPVLIFPLSLERNEIDLTKLQNGVYLLKTFDYKNEIELMTKVIKE